jgi:hypothetical protein
MRLEVVLIMAGWYAFSAQCGGNQLEMSYPFDPEQRVKEAVQAREAGRFHALTHDFFSRYNHDLAAKPGAQEVGIDESWSIVLAEDAGSLAETMSGHFAQFMRERMGVALGTEKVPHTELAGCRDRAILFLESGGGDPSVAESFTLAVTLEAVRLAGLDPAGLRDGIVKLIDVIGFREAPILSRGEQVYRPRIPVRLGAHGSTRDTVLMGYNGYAVGGTLYAVSTSRAIPELVERQRPGALQAALETAREARHYGMRIFFDIETGRPMTENDPVFQAHPEIRGAKTHWGNVLCTQHPLVERYLAETVEGIFRAEPELDGISLIVGGEGFYHCFMRPDGVPRGHTNCERCEAKGAETVVAELVNSLVAAARRVNPDAEVIAWLYSAQVWSADPAQEAFIRLLKPGAAIRTDVVKDERMIKPGGLEKILWDYSIDLIGPGERSLKQIEACRRAGISIHFLTMCEDSVEYPWLPHIPCMDRWVDRSEAVAECGATGVIGGHFGTYAASSASEVYKNLWWDPAPEKQEFLQRFAARLAGAKAGPHLRAAWKHSSVAMEFSTQVGDYYHGPHFLGPAHPMCADPDAELPEIFYGSCMGRTHVPAFITSPKLTGAKAPPEVVIDYHRRMTDALADAVAEMEIAGPLVPERNRLMFDAEETSMRWFYHTTRTERNFNESCLLRDPLLSFASREQRTDEQISEATVQLTRWREVLENEAANTSDAIPVLEKDLRLDFYKRKDSVIYPHGSDMVRVKLQLLDREINQFLPEVARRCGVRDF